MFSLFFQKTKKQDKENLNGIFRKTQKHIQSFLDRDDWSYEFNEEKEYFKTGIKLDGKLKRCDIIVDIREDYYIVYGIIDITADKNNIQNMAEFLHRVNNRLTFGSFELFYEDGEIRSKILVDCGDDCDCLPSDSIIKRSLHFPAILFDEYSDGLLGVMFDFLTPEEAIEKLDD